MMSASPDYAASATSTPDSVSEPAMASQMADVAGAMFSLLTLGSPVHEGIPASVVAEPADPPAVLSASAEPSQASAVPVPVPLLDVEPALAPVIAPIPMPASLSMPASLPMLDYVPEPVAAEAPAEPEHAVAVTASAPPPNMAMLSEIGFLDD